MDAAGTAITISTTSPERTRSLAEAVGRAVDPLPGKGLTISLVGDLGAGKTTFAQGLLRGLGVPPEARVVSPTFTFARSYLGRMPVHHVDAYHVAGLQALEASGFEEMCGEGRVTVVEWGDRIARALPSDRIEVEISSAPEPEGGSTSPTEPGPGSPRRRIEIRALGAASARIVARLSRPGVEAASAETSTSPRGG